MSEPSIGGIFETCIGTRDALPLVHYFEQFGYRIGCIGTFEPDAVEKLHGVRSDLPPSVCERSVSFVAPDGYSWNLLERT